MKAKAILALACFFALQAASQDMPKAQREAQCKFSDGKTITITYSSEGVKTARLATDEDLATVKGINIPAGDYSVFPAKDSHNWSLRMTRRTGKGESLELASVPLSVTRPALPVANFNIAFDHTGGSCMMHWNSENSNVLLSLEFTEKNADVPVIP